ncbi:19388_t:CDS:1, partial [Gigaspora rosea]
LELSFNEIDFEGGNLFVQALHENNRLSILKLGSNKIKPKEEIFLIKASRNIIKFIF